MTVSTTTTNYAPPRLTPTMPPDNHQARIKRHTESSRTQSVPDVVSIGRNTRTEQRIILCPSWWGLLRRKRWADNYIDDDAQRYQHPDTDPSFARSALTENAPTILPMSDALCRIEPALRPISFVLHIAGQYAGLTALTLPADEAMTDLVPIGDGKSFMDPLIAVVSAEIESAVETGRVPSSRERDLIGPEGVEVLVVATDKTTNKPGRGAELVEYALKKLNEASIPAMRVGIEEIEISARMAGVLSRDSQHDIRPMSSEAHRAGNETHRGGEDATPPRPGRTQQNPHNRMRTDKDASLNPPKRKKTDLRPPRRDYRRGGFLLRHRNALAVTMCTLVLIGTALAVTLRSAGNHEQTNQAEANPERTDGNDRAEGGDATGEQAALSAAPASSDHHDQPGGIVDNGIVRAALTSGWIRSHSSTPERLILEDPADEDIRILVSGHPVQPDVTDAHLREHVESMVQTRAEFSDYAPESAWRQGAVSYEERPEGGSVVQWTTFLQEGKQVSVGCQWKGELTAKRTAACSTAARSAEVMPS